MVRVAVVFAVELAYVSFVVSGGREEAFAGEERVLLQGLIQVAAGFHKATVQRQPNGCVKLLSAGLDKLRAVPEDLLGSELAAFTAKVEAALREALRWQAGEVAGVAKGSIPTLGPDFSLQP